MKCASFRHHWQRSDSEKCVLQFQNTHNLLSFESVIISRHANRSRCQMLWQHKSSTNSFRSPVISVWFGGGTSSYVNYLKPSKIHSNIRFEVIIYNGAMSVTLTTHKYACVTTLLSIVAWVPRDSSERKMIFERCVRYCDPVTLRCIAYQSGTSSAILLHSANNMTCE